MNRLLKVTSLLGLAVILGGWANPFKGVKADENIKIEPISLSITQDDVKVGYKKEVDPSQYIVSGIYDSISYPVVDTSTIGEQVITYIAKKDLQVIKIDKTITVEDQDAPEVEGPSEISLKWNSDEDIKALFTVTDEIDENPRIEVRNEPDRKEGGQHQIQVVGIDENGNEKIKDVTLNIAENLPPVIEGSSELQFKYDSKVNILDYYKAIDDIDGEVSVKLVNDVNRKTAGVQTITLEASDEQGNVTKKDVKVTVAENKAPEIEGPSSLTLRYKSVARILDYYSATDLEDGKVAVKIAKDINRSQSGVQTLTLEAKDSYGKVTTKNVSITVKSNNAPVISGPSSLTLRYKSSANLLSYFKATDAEDGRLKINVSQDINRSKQGTQTLVLKATDNDGATTTRNISIIVKGNNAPTISGPSSLSLKYNSTARITSYYSARDAEDGRLKVSLVSDVNRTQSGTHKVTLVATDSNGAKATKTVSIKIASKPVVQTAVSSISSSSSYSGSGSTIVSIARRYLGYRYVFGGSSPSGFDCSGFTKYVYGRVGIYLPHTARGQMARGYRVSNPRPGDLVFYGSGAHVGIYLGNGRQIHALNPRQGVLITGMRLSHGYPSQYRRYVR